LSFDTKTPRKKRRHKIKSTKKGNTKLSKNEKVWKIPQARGQMASLNQMRLSTMDSFQPTYSTRFPCPLTNTNTQDQAAMVQGLARLVSCRSISPILVHGGKGQTRPGDVKAEILGD
jgi:hypothetical protein